MPHFIKSLLPSQGLYCSAQAASKGYIHKFFDSVDDLIVHVLMQDAAGHTMYISQATFDSEAIREAQAHNQQLPKDAPKDQKKKLRSQRNVVFLRNFFFDVDCGADKFEATPTKAYPTQRDGALAIKQFADSLGLPLPTVVNSGNGLYAHWLIEEDVPADQWKALAATLKDVATAAGFRQDPSRTSDAASVLRPVGTTNRKGTPKPVHLIHESAPIHLATFIDALAQASKKYQVTSAVFAPPTEFKGLNDEFTAGIEGPEASLLIVAEKCAQVRKVRDSLGNVDEPVWYNFIGLARYTTEGKNRAIIHEWSQGHPSYSAATTNAKIDHHIESGTGPTTCKKFGIDNPGGCIGCPHANSIKSPIVLGRAAPESIVSEEDEDVTPAGYLRSEKGLFYDDDGRMHRFYPYDLFVASIAYDGTLGYEVATIKHHMPMSTETEDGYMTFAFRSALIHDPKALLMALSDNHVQTTGKDSRTHMMNYIDYSMAALRAKRQLAQLHSQMGWRDVDGVLNFVLGAQLYRKDQETTEIGFAKNVPDCGKAFCSQGDLAAWKSATTFLGQPGMEPLAFAFLAGAFGSPLIRFTGFAGALVALVGRSGVGKSLVGELISSVYGDPRRLILLKDDTKNFLVQRLGLYGSLPLYIDEISNIEGQELSDLAYKITQGRDKGRLTRSGTERAMINSWNTVVVASSNHSLTDKLAALKMDASAEINRVVELSTNSLDDFDQSSATQIYHAFHSHFGVAGPPFIEYVTNNQEGHRDKINAIITKLNSSTAALPEERFWSAIAGVAIYGGLVAAKLGLIDFEVAPLIPWIKEHILQARECREENVVNYVDFLGQFLDKHVSGSLITAHNGPKEVVQILREPHGQLVYRVNTDTDRLYISKQVLREFLDKNYGSYTALRRELEKVGALISTDKRKVLGGGTYFGGSQQIVWEIDLNCRALGRVTLSLVRASDLHENRTATN